VIANNTVSSGPGGSGGIDSVEARAGQGGNSCPVCDSDPNDKAVPPLSGNTLTPGSGGAGGFPGKYGDSARTNL
jgi:hypothetical protein